MEIIFINVAVEKEVVWWFPDTHVIISAAVKTFRHRYLSAISSRIAAI